jgi:hypothetical protein
VLNEKSGRLKEKSNAPGDDPALIEQVACRTLVLTTTTG